MSDTSNFHDDYYVQSYSEGGKWSARYPNNDEAVRAGMLIRIVTQIARDYYETQPDASALKILDVGSGRGWLTYLLSMYGESQGVEPVAGVVEYAQTLYPNNIFTVGTPQTLLEQGHENSFDLIICTEVIEHVDPRIAQADFMQALADLIKPNGQIVLTTPRGEIHDDWMRLKTKANEPVENWLTKDALLKLATDSGLQTVFHRPFATHGFMLRSSLPTRIIQRVMRMIGYAGAEPINLMTYQLVQLRK